jgi:hypothetical protein
MLEVGGTCHKQLKMSQAPSECSDSKRQRFEWTDEMTKQLIQLFLAESETGNGSDGGFKQQGWNHILTFLFPLGAVFLFTCRQNR